MKYNKKNPTIYYIDLFAGAGGTSTGIHLADANVKVIACVNHDATAISSHKANHPETLHFVEDIRDFKVVQKLKSIVEKLRAKEPNCFINIWASLECTNYSKAKGGLPRDADSRTLAWDLIMYLENLNPDYLYIENVREFMAWGELDKKGKPIKMRNGCDYIKWTNAVQNLDFNYDWKMLNSADFGAYTSRNRYFGIFAKKGLPISFPKATHYDPRKLKKNTKNSLFDFELKPWKAVKEVLNFDEKGKSIFTRKKELSENTLKRIYAGLIKFIANSNEKEFTKVYNSGNYFNRVKSVNEPIGTLTTQNSHALVQVQTSFIKKYYSGRPFGKVSSLNLPAGTITTIDGQALVQTEFMQRRNTGNPNSKVISLNKPSRTLTSTGGNLELVQTKFFSEYYGNGKPQSINTPLPTITTKDRFALNEVKWLNDTQFGRVGQGLDQPSFTLIASMGKKPPYLISANKINQNFYLVNCKNKKPSISITKKRNVIIRIFYDDNQTMIKIKHFMAFYGIVDITMRMLLVQELKIIQGFPKNYILNGTQTQQKKQIGNSVVPLVAQKLVEANHYALVKKNGD